METSPKTRFRRLLDHAPEPQVGDSSAMGTMFTCAFRYCEPMRLASSFGWYIFSPVDMDLIFDGATTYWRSINDSAWQKLDSLKDLTFRNEFESMCPESLKGTAPVTIGKSAEPGILQLWSGYILQTPPGYCALVRDPPNIPKLENFESYEGIIQSDDWFGPLLTNIRITKTDVVVSIRRNMPIFFVQLVRSEDCARSIHRSFELDTGIEKFSEKDWRNYSKVMKNSLTSSRDKGLYAREIRRKNREINSK